MREVYTGVRAVTAAMTPATMLAGLEGIRSRSRLASLESEGCAAESLPQSSSCFIGEQCLCGGDKAIHHAAGAAADCVGKHLAVAEALHGAQ